jgi:ParB family chromosome partitioning protein
MMAKKLIGIQWTNVRVKLGDLKPWARNPRMSSKAQAQRILKSFDEFGQVQVFAIGPKSEVYDGHQRLSALLTVHGEAHEIDARRSSRPLTEPERERLVLMLHAGATGAWDWDALSNWDTDLLAQSGFDDELLKQINRDAAAVMEFLDAGPNFEPVGEDEQGRLDQKSPIKCPHCGEKFVPV